MAEPNKTIVIKVGTSSLVRIEKGAINISALSLLCETVSNLRAKGHRVVIVSSGAVGVGCQRLGLSVRPKELAKRQALAAAGQVHLMRYYDDFFSAIGVTCAQVMLTLDNLANLSQYTNTRSTFEELFGYGIVPVVNENDTVAVEELHFGDNDTLSAKVATAVRADWLFLLTDVDALYTSNPSKDPEARPISAVHDISQLQVDTATSGTKWGTGGMSTKLTAARIATAAGCNTVICRASRPENIERILDGEAIGTVFFHHPKALKGRKRWIMMVPSKGQLWMDEGAVRAVRQRAKSLFSAGIVRVIGVFNAQDAVQLCDASGTPFAQGLCNYASPDVIKLKGKRSQDIGAILGFCGSEEVVHRDNISMMALRNPPMDATSPAPPYAVLDDESSDGDDTKDALPQGEASSSGPAGQETEERDDSGAAGAVTVLAAEAASDPSFEPSAALQRDAAEQDWERREDSDVLSPRSDSVTSLTRGAAAENVAPSLPGFGSLPPPRQQPRTLQRASSEDSPNPLPSPASGFRARAALTSQRPSSPKQRDSQQATARSMPRLEIPDPASAVRGGSDSASPVVDNLHAVVSPDVASAALMSSQGPIREATEADIAARRAIIAAAKAGKMIDLSPRQVPPTLSQPATQQLAGLTAAPSSSRTSLGAGTAFALGGAAVVGRDPADREAGSGESPVAIQSSGKPGAVLSARELPPTKGSPSSAKSDAERTSPSGSAGGSNRGVAAPGSAAIPKTLSRSGSNQGMGSLPAGEATSRQAAAAVGAARGGQQGQPHRSMYTPMRNHDHSRSRRSIESTSPSVSRQGSGRISRQPSGSLSPRVPPQGQRAAGPLLPTGAQSQPAERDTEPLLRRVPSSGLPAAAPAQVNAPQRAANGLLEAPSNRISPPQQDVEARLAILRSRGDAAGEPSSPAGKRVSFQADSTVT